jgi:deoxyribodipyrimidine photo-lyase
MAHIFIFRRDFRLHDNLAFTALQEEVHKEGGVIYPIFIFNPKQIDPKQNKYFNKNSVEFMIQSLHSLDKALDNKITYFHGDDIEVLKTIKKSLNIDIKTVAFNTDFTPFAMKRDAYINSWGIKNKIKVLSKEDYTLLPLNHVKTGAGTYFSVFTPFYKKVLLHVKDIPSPQDNKNIKLSSVSTIPSSKDIKRYIVYVDEIDKYYMNNPNHYLYVKGGRQNALNILAKISKGEFSNYDKERDLPYLDKTTKLSAYLKFGCVSIREVFDTIKKEYGVNHGLIRELIWREFYANITFNKPRVLEGQIGKKNLPFREKYDNFNWNSNLNTQIWWSAFMKGQTGFPFIDAGIRMLYKTGFCPNRLRMILAMFAIKDILIEPIIFEKWFAQHLVDYDPSSNSGGVLWSASTGVDAQPYFRVFSPWLQTERYDPETVFIKKWIPELNEVPIKDILKWEKKYVDYEHIQYPKPIVNHTERAKIVMSLFKEHS